MFIHILATFESLVTSRAFEKFTICMAFLMFDQLSSCYEGHTHFIVASTVTAFGSMSTFDGRIVRTFEWADTNTNLFDLCIL